MKNNSRKEYHLKLQSFYTQPISGNENLTLADIYVDPNFKVYKKSFTADRLKNYEIDDDGFCDPKYEGGNLHDYVIDRFNKKNVLELKAERSNFTIVLGQPGQGKTSFCKRILYDLLSKNILGERNLYFVRLREMANVQNAIDDPFEVIRKHIARTEFKTDEPVPLEDLEDAILVLDGLDELYMQNGLTNADINTLVNRLSSEQKHFKDLNIFLVSRYNYINIDEFNGEKYLVLKLAEFSLNQQTEWLDKYKKIYKTCKLTPSTLRNINNRRDIQYQGIKTLINQPLLLQMIAQSDLDITDRSNRAHIYQTLFDNIIERKWSEDGQLEKHGDLTKKDFRVFLQTIALAIYYSDAEFIPINDFESNKLLLEAKDRFLEKRGDNLSLKDALKDIQASFYFKNKKKLIPERENNWFDHEEVIEFLHKPFQEYLVAEKVWFLFRDTFLTKKANKEYIIDNWKDALEEIYPVVAHKILSKDVISYLLQIIDNDLDVSRKQELAERLNYFLPDLIKRDFLHQFDVNKELQPFDKGLPVFYVYWTILSHLRPNNTVEEKSRNRFIFLLKSLTNLFGGIQINLRGAEMTHAFLAGIYLENANLVGFDALGANMDRSNLEGANLANAHLTGVYLEGARLASANLANAYLKRAKLMCANLGSANMNGADLRAANLQNSTGLTVEQLLKTKSLKNAIGLPTELELELRRQKPSLFV